MATQITPAPELPQLGEDSATFDSKVQAFFNWLKDNLQPDINTLAEEVEDNRDDTETIKNQTNTLYNDVVYLKNETNTLKLDCETLKLETETIKLDCETIKNDIQTIVGTGGYLGDWDSSVTYDIGKSVKYDGKLWISTQGSNQSNIPTIGDTTWWMVICDINNWVITKPTVIINNINENSSGIHTISNYDSTVTYSITSYDSLISSISISGDTITISTGDITDRVDHLVSYTIKVVKDGYLFSEVTITFTVIYVPMLADDALLWEATTYIDDNFDVV